MITPLRGVNRTPVSCSPDTRIPFMAMPDAIDGLIKLASTPREKLSRTAYNVTAFNPTAREICDVVVDAFPTARITWEIDRNAGDCRLMAGGCERCGGTARLGFAPRYDFRSAFDDYLIPTIARGIAMKFRH
jgi:nucleoside-diphosphate-sugar epimerase